MPKHDDTAVIEALVRYTFNDLANDEARIQRQALTGPPDPPLNVQNQRAKHLYFYLLTTDEAFRTSATRPTSAAAFGHALKRVYRALHDRGVLLVLNGNGYLIIEAL